MKFVVVFLTILICSCSIDRTISPIHTEESKQLTEFEHLDSINRVEIADSSEPGEKMVLCLTFLRKEDQSPLKNRTVSFFQATARGEYEPQKLNDESTARLSGKAKTDSKGRIFVKTILPGDYGSTADNRHIHTTVEGARPEAYDINFSQYANFGLKKFIEKSDQNFLVNLKYATDSTLVGFLTIEPKNTK